MDLTLSCVFAFSKSKQYGQPYQENIFIQKIKIILSPQNYIMVYSEVYRHSLF